MFEEKTYDSKHKTKSWYKVYFGVCMVVGSSIVYFLNAYKNLAHLKISCLIFNSFGWILLFDKFFHFQLLYRWNEIKMNSFKWTKYKTIQFFIIVLIFGIIIVNMEFVDHIMQE